MASEVMKATVVPTRGAPLEIRDIANRFAGPGRVASHFEWNELDKINDIFARMEQGRSERAGS